MVNEILWYIEIPYYFYILTKKYEDILLTNINFKPDIIYFDFNGIIHPISSKNNSTNDIVFDNLWIFLIFLIMYCFFLCFSFYVFGLHFDGSEISEPK